MLAVCDLREKILDVERIDRLQTDTIEWYNTVQCGTVVWYSGVVQWCGHPIDLSLARRTIEN